MNTGMYPHGPPQNQHTPTLTFQCPLTAKAMILRAELDNPEELELDTIVLHLRDLTEYASNVIRLAKQIGRDDQPEREVRSLRHAIALIGTVRLREILEGEIHLDGRHRTSA